MIDIQEEGPRVLDLGTREEKQRAFGSEQERSIISLAFDYPEFFLIVGSHLDTEYFSDLPTKYVFTLINYHLEKHDVVISRGLCRDEVLKQLTVDDEYEEILSVIDRKSDPREIPIIKETLIDWCREKAYSQIYSRESIEAHERGDYNHLEQIIEDARRITDISSSGVSFFDNVDSLFNESDETHLPTGFDRLDAVLNEGGPTFGDVMVWMAPTGVGKSIMLVNSGVACIKRGLNVLHVTLELSELKTRLRYMGALTDHHIKRRFDEKEKIVKKLNRMKETYEARLEIVEFPPDDISADTIYALLDTYRRQYGVKFDVLILDYLELLMARESAYNKTGDEYGRQKKTSTELRSLAKKENLLVFTASQTNRSGTDIQESRGEKVIDLNKVAESYGKTMPTDYIVTINQTKREYEEGRLRPEDPTSPNTKAVCRLYVAKNRNGPKFTIINARINYETMKATQEQFL